MINPKYTVILTNTQTDEEFDLPYISLGFTEQLNKGKNANFRLDYRSVKKVTDYYGTTPLFLLTGGTREVAIKKDDTVIYLGVLSDTDFFKNPNGLLQIALASVSLETMLKKRRTDDERLFTSTDAGTIAWTLIDESQLSDVPYSDLGITQGAITTSVNRQRTFRFANVLDEIFKMSNENLKNGFDFEVDNLKKFNVFYPTKGSNRDNIWLDNSNLVNWKFRKPLVLNLTNQVYVLGEGFEENLVWTLRTSPVAFRSAFGLLEDLLSERDTGTLANLEDKGDKFLADNQSPILNLQFVHKDDDPDILTYEVGDSLKVNIPEAEIVDEFRRVLRRRVDIDTQGRALITLQLE